MSRGRDKIKSDSGPFSGQVVTAGIGRDRGGRQARRHPGRDQLLTIELL